MRVADGGLVQLYPGASVSGVIKSVSTIGELRGRLERRACTAASLPWALVHPIPHRLASIPTADVPRKATVGLTLEVGLGRGLRTGGPDRRPS
jgi:hypothetical protein